MSAYFVTFLITSWSARKFTGLVRWTSKPASSLRRRSYSLMNEENVDSVSSISRATPFGRISPSAHGWRIANSRKIHQTLADAPQALRHPVHARQAFLGVRIGIGLDQFFDRTRQHRQRCVQLMRYARREQAQAHQTVLFFYAPERRR